MSCVNNPIVQLLVTSTYLPECPTPKRTQQVVLEDIPAYVLNLDGMESRFEDVRELFGQHGLRLNRFPALRGIARPEYNMTAGEVGYLNSMAAVMRMAIDKNLKRVLVFDDDAVPHCEFREKFLDLVEGDRRCGGYQFTDSQGGFLLLGSSVWTMGSYPKTMWGGWNIIDAEIRNVTEKVRGAQPKCYNAHDKSLGSFAVLYHRNVFEPILDLLTTRPDLRFDWLWFELGRLGYIGRAAYPSLVIQDVRHESQVDPSRNSQSDISKRAKTHRWDLSTFCGANGEKIFA